MRLGAGHSSHPCRCSRRACQARVTLRKAPWLYKRWPKCPNRCGGHLYVDRYRLRKLEVRQRSVCKSDCYPYPHRVDSPECKKRTDFLLEKSLDPISKHRPFKQETEDEVPF